MNTVAALMQELRRANSAPEDSALAVFTMRMPRTRPGALD